jgi:hypothetical protein
MLPFLGGQETATGVPPLGGIPVGGCRFLLLWRFAYRFGALVLWVWFSYLWFSENGGFWGGCTGRFLWVNF